MKKFLVLSAIVGIAGLGIGIAGRQSDSPATTLEATAEVTTSTTAPAPATTGRQVAAKPAAIATTTTRPASVASPATATTARPQVVSTTTTSPVPLVTTTSTVAVKRTCSLAVDQPTVTPGATQTIRMSSNMPSVQVQIKTDSAGSGWMSTDSNGSASWSFAAPTAAGPVPVRTLFSFAKGSTTGSICSTSFTVAS